jgi:hypothetical protein
MVVAGIIVVATILALTHQQTTKEILLPIIRYFW